MRKLHGIAAVGPMKITCLGLKNLNFCDIYNLGISGVVCFVVKHLLAAFDDI